MNTEENWAYELESEYSHVSELQDVECAKEFISDVLEALYGDSSLDQMENSLEEACACLKVPFPTTELKITKSNPYFETNNPYFQVGLAISKHQAQLILNKRRTT